MKFGVVVFPGSNSEEDTVYVLREVMGLQAVYLWHDETDLQEVDVVIVPGGFAHGDYLRCGAIAKFSPVMESVRHHAASGGLVLGICNGFQILQETGLLPGAMLRNKRLKYLCELLSVRVERTDTPFTGACHPGQVLKLPISHHDGSFFVPPAELEDLRVREQVLFRFCDEDGVSTPDSNPNGSVDHIAGVVNREGNVMALMPHPERAAESILGSSDGRLIFESMVNSLQTV